MNAQQLAAHGFSLHQTGRLREAESLYRQALQVDPRLADAWHLLGVAEHQQGRNAEALEHIQSAIRLQPTSGGYHSNLGSVLAAMGRFEEGAAALATAVRLDPSAPQAHNNLGNALRELKRLPEAEAAYRRAIAIWPDYPEAYYHLAGVLNAQRRFEEAEGMYRRSIQLRPNYSEALNNLGTLLLNRSRYAESIQCFERAIAIKPDYADAMNNLGNALRAIDRYADAIAMFQRALSIRQDADVLNNLASVYLDEHRLDEAEATILEALKMRPQFAEALATLGAVHKDAGRMEEAMGFFAQSLAVKETPYLPGNALFNLHHVDGVNLETILVEHSKWNERYAKPVAPAEFSPRRRSRGPRLRIGYVSPDFAHHPVGRFILPLLQNHDRGRFEIFCYADTHTQDAVTTKIKACTDNWRVTLESSDDELYEIIRNNEIDILIDLAAHTRHNRMFTFARKPAPVQVTYLAYPSTTGLATIDYRFTDPYIDPVGHDPGYCERALRLPNSYWCFAAPENSPNVGPLPADDAGAITFACMNQYTKVTPRLRAAWRELLRRAPSSRLLVHSPRGRHRSDAQRELQLDGLDPNRLQFVDAVPYYEYLDRFNQIDIGLDTFPYCGGTTTCEALWMGVPVVSLAGDLSISRGGLSVLSNIGLAELTAKTLDEYVNIAAELAVDLSRVRSLRADMRQRMIASPLMDAPRFARDFETLLESIAPVP